MELSNRLKAIVNLVSPGKRVADVGCDHGFVSIYLYEQKISPKVYAMDLRPGPLARAQEHIDAYGYADYIETRLSDGITALKAGEADALICAGMGGRLMAKILSDGYDKIMQMKELILQPQSDLAYFREYLRTHQLKIIAEDMVKEEGKFYPMMKVVPVTECENEEDGICGQSVEKPDLSFLGERARQLADNYGPFLLAERNPVLKEYLEVVRQRDKDILCRLTGPNEKAALRKEEVMQELSDIELCLSYL